MKKIKLTILICLTFLSFGATAQLSVNGYTNFALSGYDVLVEDAAFVQDSALTNTALTLLETKLIEISQFNINQTKKDSLMAVPIFVDWNTTMGAAQYHPSQAWLIANGYAPEKARCVEISNITNFINWTNQNQPYMVLHELAHAYHHRVLGFSSSLITNAFNNASSTNLYTNVSYHTGGGNYITQAMAYALNNDREYFAEISEAYFGLNDYFPFDYNDLSGYDPVGFSAARQIWGDIVVSVPDVARIASVVYPNPSQGMFTLDIGAADAGTLKYEVTDLAGRRIIASKIEAGSVPVKLDVRGEVDGIYLLKLIQGERSQVLKIVKESW